tara:strand:+ start:1454 stop:3148 length:1695 start_codon:yes stop_codon:yes gene_type:complete
MVDDPNRNRGRRAGDVDGMNRRNTDVFTQDQGQFEMLRAQERAMAKLGGDLRQSARQIKTAFANFANPINRLRDSLTRLDESNRSALRMGITTEKLRQSVAKNSEILDRGLVSNQKLLDAISLNFESGVRVQNGALMTLTEEMVATGQDTKVLAQRNSDLMLFTGDNTASIQSASKVNKEVSDKYGVSNEKLINSMNTLRASFEEASFFGPEVTTSLQNVATELIGRTGGKGVEGAIQTLLGLGTGGLETVRAAAMTGAMGLRERIGARQAVGLEDFMPILENLRRMADESGGGQFGANLVAFRTGLEKQQVTGLLNLERQLQLNFEVSDEIKKTNNDTFNNIKNINERALNFYDDTALKMLDVLGHIDTALLAAIAAGSLGAAGGFNALRGVFGAGGGTGIMARGAARLGRGAAVAGLGYLAGSMIPEDSKVMGASTGGLVQGAAMGAGVGALVPIPGAMLIGAGIGATMSYFESISENTAKSAKADTERLRMEKEERDIKRARAAADDIKRSQGLIDYLRSRGMIQAEDATDVLKDLRAEAVSRNARDRFNVNNTDVPNGGR